MKNQPSLLRLWSRLWPQITFKRRCQLGIIFTLMMLASVAEVISIGTILPFLAVLTAPQQVFDHPYLQSAIGFLGIESPKQLLLPLTMGFCLAVVVAALMRLLLLWTQTRFSHAIGADFSISIYRRTLYQPYAVHVGRNSSEIIAAISSKAHEVVHSTIIPVLTLISSFVLLAFTLSALMTIESTVALSAFLGFGSIYALVAFVTKKRLLIDSQRINKESIQVYKALQEGLGGIRDVLLDGSQPTYCEIYRRADLPLRRAQANIQILGSGPRFVIESFGMVLMAILALSLAGQSDGIMGSIPVLGALALGAQRILPVLQQSYVAWTAIRGGQASLQDALLLLEQPLPSFADDISTPPIRFINNISLTDLSFQYSSNLPCVLTGINLNIVKGARVGFIGTTGGGKSTLLDVLMGLLQPTSGHISIDGQIISLKNVRAWQSHIAHVPQAIFLSDTTISENIAFGVPVGQIDITRVKLAAEKAQIAETIESWPGGYDTRVGERGVRLSGGQRQRIGIARALYKQADVIIFDEATSALDNETEEAVMQSIDSLGNDLTILMIAHRLSTLKKCTLIVDLRKGRLVRVGTYTQLIDPSAKELPGDS